MSDHVLELAGVDEGQQAPGRRHHEAQEDALVLSELPPSSVLDPLTPCDAPLELTTFGAVRELCPKCQASHLKLVLRQSCVRTAHLFCTSCESCFDAHYPNGASALTI
jgi:hypothetical protein